MTFKKVPVWLYLIVAFRFSPVSSRKSICRHFLFGWPEAAKCVPPEIA